MTRASGQRMRGEGEYAEHLSKLFAVARRQGRN